MGDKRPDLRRELLDDPRHQRRIVLRQRAHGRGVRLLGVGRLVVATHGLSPSLCTLTRWLGGQCGFVSLLSLLGVGPSSQRLFVVDRRRETVRAFIPEIVAPIRLGQVT